MTFRCRYLQTRVISLEAAAALRCKLGSLMALPQSRALAKVPIDLERDPMYIGKTRSLYQIRGSLHKTAKTKQMHVATPSIYKNKSILYQKPVSGVDTSSGIIETASKADSLITLK